MKALVLSLVAATVLFLIVPASAQTSETILVAQQPTTATDARPEPTGSAPPAAINTDARLPLPIPPGDYKGRWVFGPNSNTMWFTFKEVATNGTLGGSCTW